MKSYKKIIARSLVGLFALTVAVVGMASTRTASAQQQTTPIFNAFTNVQGSGNEKDFVRLRKSSGDPKAGVVSNPFIDPVNATCNVGDQFDVRTYVHNGAHPEGNQSGNGNAIAHDTTVKMTAPLGTNGNKFVFGGTISASNAATVVDNGTLNCASNVRLELVPSKVFVYSLATQQWVSAPDSAVNGSLKVGSRVAGSGDVWACWDERVLVVYVVKVVAIPQVPEYKCDLLTVTKLGGANSRRYKFDVSYTAKNGATFKDVTYDFGDGTSATVGASTEHEYAKAGKFMAKATVNFMVNGVAKSHTSNDCAKEVTVTEENCPVPGKGHLPKDSPLCVETPSELPNTGAGDLIGIIVSTIVGGYIFATRRFARQ